MAQWLATDKSQHLRISLQFPGSSSLREHLEGMDETVVNPVEVIFPQPCFVGFAEVQAHDIIQGADHARSGKDRIDHLSADTKVRENQSRQTSIQGFECSS